MASDRVKTRFILESFLGGSDRVDGDGDCECHDKEWECDEHDAWARVSRVPLRGGLFFSPEFFWFVLRAR